MPDRILVTGGNGFIGKHLVVSLRAAGWYVGVMDVDCDENMQWDGIVHLAAMSRVSLAERNPVKCIEDNILLTAKVLERSFNWFVLVSTNEPPQNVYGLSKRFAEDYAAMICKVLGKRFKIVRFDTVYGPGDNPEKLIPSVRVGMEVHGGVLPITALYVRNAVWEIEQAISNLRNQMVVSTKDDLIRVANSY